MEQFKRARVVMLPTNDKTNIGKEKIGNELRFNSPRHNLYHKHLYIISDDKIKKDDWYIYLKYNTIIQKKDALPLEDNCKKIIATTDTSLRIYEPCIQCDGTSETTFSGTYTTQKKCDLCSQLKYPNTKALPQPSQQFIEKYIESYNKGEVITDVLVEYEIQRQCVKCKTIRSHYLCKCGEQDNYENTLQLKINPKDNTITIKKVKDSWSREELTDILQVYRLDYEQYKRSCHYGPNQKEIVDWSNKWIEENL